MKKLNLLTIFIILVFASVSFGQGIGNASNPHNFSNAGWNTDGEICEPCHTPHNADMTVSGSPLWNHEVTGDGFTLYSSPSLDATMGQPNGTSKLCLSCHDGTIAMDSFGGATGNTNLTSSALIGKDLSDDHPISFPYTTASASADGGLHNPALQPSGLGGTIQADMLSADQMQCSSCHDAHNNTEGMFLLMSNDASALCLTCHNK